MADKPDVKEEISEDELDQIIQDMSDEEEAETAAKPTVLEVVQSKKAEAASTATTTGGQALTLELNGSINLKLCFKNGDRSINVVCGDDALVCTMADGTEFRIPIHANKVRKAA